MSKEIYCKLQPKRASVLSNPSLASHGGEVSLVQITDDKVAVLQFGGGCQGCGQVEATLKDGVEKSLMLQVPELNAVMDVTDHTDRSHAYFK
jgi:Fe/S biogenesis protein NfuA